MDAAKTGPELVVVGSANADLVLRVERLPGPGETVPGSPVRTHAGGKGANQAAAAARLGARVALLARVGADAHGDLLLAAQRAAGVDTGPVLTGGAPTGLALITVGPDGENTIVVSAGANALLSAADVRAAAGLLRAAPVVSLQLEIPLESVVEVVRTVGPGTRMVLNASPPVPLPAEVLTACDPLVVNEHEARLLLGGRGSGGRSEGDGDGERDGAGDGKGAGAGTPEAWAAALLARGARSVVVTLGRAGALVADAGGTSRLPSPVVEAVDTTGAGDAFTGALAWRLGAGDNLAAAAGLAVRVGAATVTRQGAQSSFPTPEELPER
ncbi:ribokinase [Kitasatospora herbaricolor]|uniref:ribokinase n=1 Tax=Kitasatospora herbaricolor TaxID=68217 RepID=UPI0017482464|nr:ribokinase [Kitasatospora herbaricolor]MDQ0306306.1 ribokinase [Kitasatospora herbaricolor]GGV40250.1 ribokinase [Kitasatospora herbaricolor]